MYHKVSAAPEDGLNVNPSTLKDQIQAVFDLGFKPIGLQDLLAHVEQRLPLPDKCFLISFDDAYVNNLEVAAPVLASFSLKPVVFVPTAFMGQTNEWDKGSDKLMLTKELTKLKEAGWAIGFHGHRHLHLGKIPHIEAEEDLGLMLKTCETSSVFDLVLAFPYGGRPRNQNARKKFNLLLRKMGLRCAFRIGNRINSLPLKNRYQIERLDITGNLTPLEFRRKLKYGKLL